MEITGNAPGSSDSEERRRAIASRIVIGREELDRMGDSSLADVLKRLPGVTLGGPPGRRGAPSMRGMGGGYTVILIDGQRMPPGFSLDSLPPEQVERIEVMRSPVAEFSTQAIAGIINVVMRADFKRKANELRAGGGVEGSRPRYGGNWTRNGNSEALGWNTSVAMFGGESDSRSETHTEGGFDADGTPITTQDALRESRGRNAVMFANARLQLRLGAGKSLELQPFLNLSQGRSETTTTRSAPTPAATAALPYALSAGNGRNEGASARLNTTLNLALGNGGRLQVLASSRLNQNHSESDALQTGGRAGAGRRVVEDTRIRQLTMENKGKYSLLIRERHSMSAGWELERAHRNDQRRATLDGVPQGNDFGADLDARVLRTALFAQDEWEWSKQLSFYVGARWEGIETRGGDAAAEVRNRSSVLTPLAHLVWKLPDRPRDQVRASLTRSYRAPDLGQLVGRVSRSSAFPDASKPNTADFPDRIGNPALKPELAWSLELGYEHYLEGNGVLSANTFYKRIDQLIRSTPFTLPATATTAQRFATRPENLGAADTAGIELEAKGRASDFLPTQLPIDLRANLSFFWSRVNAVPGPDNRIDGQAPWTTNLGADWPMAGTPFTLGASWNFTPAFRVRQQDDRASREGRKSQIDAYVLWRLAPEAHLRLNLTNVQGNPYLSGSDILNPVGAALVQRSDTRARTYTGVNLRAEIKF